MNNFNNLKNFVDFICIGSKQLLEASDNNIVEARRLYKEHLFNLMIEADVDDVVAGCLAADLTDAFFDRYTEE